METETISKTEILGWEELLGKLDAAGRQYANLVRVHAERKLSFDVECAKIEREIRTNPVEYGLSGRPTEGAIDSAIYATGTYHIGKLAVIEAEHDVNLAAGELEFLRAMRAAREILDAKN